MDLFKNLVVIDLSNVLAGPLAGTFFAELGAKVIKIENKKTGGDVTRQWKVPGEKKGAVSAYYASANWGKKTILLDLGSGKERKKVYELVKKADLVISNYKAGDARKLGMDYTSLKKHNHQLIYGHVSGFGEANKRIAYDLVIQAETGFMSINGTEKSGALKMPLAFIDILAAHQLKEALLIALMKRSRTGRGCKVSISLYDAALSSLANQGSNWLMAKHKPGRSGSLHPNIAPYGEIFETKDGKEIVLAVGSDKQFALLCRLLGAQKLSSDQRFHDNTLRVKNRKALQKLLAPCFARRSSTALMNSFIGKGVPAALLRTIPEVLANPANRHLILKEETAAKQKTLRLRTAAFRIY